MDESQGVRVVVQVRETVQPRCRILTRVERRGRCVWLCEREVVLVDGDAAAMERTALAAAASLAAHLARWPACTRNCARDQSACAVCETYLNRRSFGSVDTSTTARSSDDPRAT